MSKTNNENRECKCPKCRASIEWTYEKPYQEYPGAKVWGGYWYAECVCGWDDTRNDMGGYSVRENTRGW
jgi:hypothetical protein